MYKITSKYELFQSDIANSKTKDVFTDRNRERSFTKKLRSSVKYREKIKLYIKIHTRVSIRELII